MKKMSITKKISVGIALTSTLGFLSGCTNSVTLNSSYHHDSIDIFVRGPRRIKVGDSCQYTVEVKTNQNAADIIWTISDPNFGDITQEGVFVPTAIGTVSVIASLKDDPNISTAYKVIVDRPLPQSLTINGPDRAVVGTHETYTAIPTPELASSDVRWQSSDTSIATITETGELHPYQAGEIEVIATSKLDQSVEARKSVKVVDAKPESISIVGVAELDPGQVFTYDVTTKPEKAYKEIRWSIDDTSVATINAITGELKVVADFGSATITAQALFKEGETTEVVATATLVITIGHYHNISLVHTIGTGYTMVSPRIEHGKEHKAKFVSSTYKISDKDIPTHKNLKLSDIQVVMNDGQADTLITNECTLVDNVLTIPSTRAIGDIRIYILGAEISDVITWPTLVAISNEGAFATDEPVKKLFQVGDYKMLYHEGKQVCYAKIIDMYHDWYLANNPTTGDKEIIHSAFTFEFQKPISRSLWGHVTITDLSFRACDFDEYDCVVRGKAQAYRCDSLMKIISKDEYIPYIRTTRVDIGRSWETPRKIESSDQLFWPMSLFEATGATGPNYWDEGPATEGTRYVYYNDDAEEKYEDFVHNAQERLAEKADDSGYFLRSTGTDSRSGYAYGEYTYIKKDGTWGCADAKVETDKYIKEFYPLFSI